MTTQPASDARFAAFVNSEGEPPCDPPDACPDCRLFDRQRPGETRRGWLLRITALLRSPVPQAGVGQGAEG